MTANLLVLKFIDEGKLTVDEAVQLLETMTAQEEMNLSETIMNTGEYIPLFIIVSADTQ